MLTANMYVSIAYNSCIQMYVDHSNSNVTEHHGMSKHYRTLQSLSTYTRTNDNNATDPASTKPSMCLCSMTYTYSNAHRTS